MCTIFIMSIHVMTISKLYSKMLSIQPICRYSRLSIHAIFSNMYYMEIPTNIFEIVIRTDISIYVAVDTSGFYCIYIYINII